MTMEGGVKETTIIPNRKRVHNTIRISGMKEMILFKLKRILAASG